jgi:hypothetical protein
MDGENGALNNDAGSSPVPVQSGELVSTVEFHQSKPDGPAAKTSEGTLKTEPTDKKHPVKDGKAAESSVKPAEPKAADEAKPPAEDDRFDKHPRFQELNRRVRESEERSRELERTLRELTARAEKGGSKSDTAGDSSLPFKDVSKMKPEELLDWQSENPQEYYRNLLAQAKHELSAEFSQSFEQRSKEDAIVATYENFAKQHSDFDKMWDDGTLQEFMRSNPGHNAISAYHALTADARIKAATEKAVKEAESTFVKNQRAKRNADVLPQGPSAPGSYTHGDDALKNTKNFGGTTAVLAQRLADRRRSQAGM